MVEVLKGEVKCWSLQGVKGLTGNLSLQYLYITQQTCNENTQTYLVEVFVLILYQILKTN